MKLYQYHKDFIDKYIKLTPEQRMDAIVKFGRTNGKALAIEQLRKAMVLDMWYKHKCYTKAKRIMLKKRKGHRI
jgi:hypothetical protein